ncbi:MAG: 50S ribosomal protein L11 [Planctomycetes bacterium]|nr:50S ribosomal protein L11 [Planctomycetota bacterium]NUQ34998.1 50S ribosomal protein L11 [Planctomycetaceae bacterium]
MAKEMVAKVKLQCPGGQATPAPPVGPALGQHGVNIGAFVKQFNDATRDRMGLILPVEIFIFKDKSFEFKVKSPPASVLLKLAIKAPKGSKTPGREQLGTVPMDKVIEIAKTKMEDLNSGSLRAACKVVAGTARSMGLQVTGELPNE